MHNIEMTFDELLTMKALQFKFSLSGGSELLSKLVDSDEAQAEAIGMKNICFRMHPVTQARLEVAIGALRMSKQEALTEAVDEMLSRFDVKLRELGIGELSYEARLRELGYALEPEDEEGKRNIVRLPKEANCKRLAIPP